ncbi:MAG: replication-relaxation family protein [Coriobacteriia bacterium]
MSRPRVSRGRLEEIRSSLSERDLEILESVATNRFLTSHQIRRLHFANHASEAASIRSTNRALARLATLQLICHLNRRIGGIRSGSGSNVWSLAETGARLLRNACDVELSKRFRTHEPTANFLEHTLAVAEVCLRLSEAAQSDSFAVLELQREPDCWRAYSSPHGGVAYLKPDLSLVTVSDDYEDHWFLEIDRDTEPPSRVIRACFKYEAYRQTGAEKKRLGIFPAVVWVTPDAKRAASLESHIAKTAGLSRGLYGVIPIDELPSLVKAGIGSQESSRES